MVSERLFCVRFLCSSAWIFFIGVYFFLVIEGCRGRIWELLRRVMVFFLERFLKWVKKMGIEYMFNID